MNKTHWTIVGVMLAAVALQLAGIQQWSDATSPQFISGVLLSLASTGAALFTDKPR